MRENLFSGLKGRVQEKAKLAPYTWFRVGGPADLLFVPQDKDDLSAFLQAIPDDMPLHVMGLASNTLFRDGGVEGAVIRMGRGFGDIQIEEDCRIRVGVAVPDVKFARAAADAGIAGFSFFRGIPGCIGGALRMNAGAHGGETKDHLVEVVALDHKGETHILSKDDMGYAYRHCSAPEELIFVEAVFQGKPGDTETLKVEMEEVATYRETHQPTKERTGGSTFKNPPGHSAWKLIDEAGCRGFRIGGAFMSEKHCNFMINDGAATAQELESLGEEVRRRVKENSGVELHWEIKRVGRL
jgi:UDP-N-acetylmuramate dehydrogenase